MKKPIDSQNFLVNVITLVFIGLGISGVDVTLDPQETVTQLFAKNFEFLYSVFIPALVKLGFSLYKKIKEGTISLKAWIKTPNFVNQLIVLIAFLLTSVGIMIPADASAQLTSAIFGSSIIALITAVITNVLTPLWYFFTKKQSQS